MFFFSLSFHPVSVFHFIHSFLCTLQLFLLGAFVRTQKKIPEEVKLKKINSQFNFSCQECLMINRAEAKKSGGKRRESIKYSKNVNFQPGEKKFSSKAFHQQQNSRQTDERGRERGKSIDFDLRKLSYQLLMIVTL
jgi:hypothetical protein